MRVVLLLLVGLTLTACAVAPTVLQGLTSPSIAIQAASKNQNGGVKGTFILTVNAIGTTPKNIFLDSAVNYRDHDNLAIAMSPRMAKEVVRHLGVPLAKLKHRHIVVTGTAERVPIYYVQGGRYTGINYYQTWVRVKSPSQVNFAN